MVESPKIVGPIDNGTSGLDTNLASLLCYMCGVVTGIIFLLIEKKDKTVRFHAWHSIVFNAVIFVFSIALSILSSIILKISFWLYGAFSVLYMVIWLGVFVIWVVLMVKAYQGSVLTLPVVTDVARQQSEK